MPPIRTTTITSGAAEASTNTSKSAKVKKPKASTSMSTSTSAAASTIDTGLPASFSRAQATKAVNALLSHASAAAQQKQETELIPKEEYVWLCVGLKTGSLKKKVMPVRIQLPHPPLPPPPTTSICLLTKSPQREYKDLLASHDIKFISRVVGTEKLKGKFKPFEARRQLMKEHELFLADERIMGYMPGLLGSIFYESKKIPIPVNMKRKDLKNELARAVASTYYVPNTGTSLSVRIATINTSTSTQTLENLLAAIPPVIAAQKGQWENILSIGIKTSNSVLLPVWSASLDGRFELPAAAAELTKKDAEQGEKKEKKKSVFELYEEEEREEARRARIAAGEAVEGDEEEVVEGKKKKAKSKSGKKGKKEGDMEVEVEPAQQLEQEEMKDMSTKAQPKTTPAPATAKAGKKVGKKSSTIGSGGAGKKAREAILGKAK